MSFRSDLHGRRAIVAACSAAALTLSACASLPADSGRGAAAALAARNGVVAAAPADLAAYTREQLAVPLTPDAAVQLALLRNPDLRARQARLGFAAADLYEASRLANPVLSAARLTGDSGPSAQLTLGIGLDITRLLFLGPNRRQAQSLFEAAQLEAASAIVELSTRTERAWLRAAAAAQVAEVRERAAAAGAASATLAQRYVDAGNLPRRRLAAEQAEASRLRMDLLAAQATAADERAALARLMGLSGAEDWTPVSPLPAPPAADPPLDTLLQAATESRLDIRSAQHAADAIADRYRWVRRTRLVGRIEAGAERERDYGGELNAGPTLSIELPLFDWGAGRKARAQAEYDAAQAHLDGLVLDRGNQVRSAYARLQLARERAGTYAGHLIPQREAVVDGLQREVNYMLTGVFELIVAKRDEYDAYAGYIEAVRDYWTARADLTEAVGRVLPAVSAPDVAPAVSNPAGAAP